MLAVVALIVVVAHSPSRDDASAAGSFPTPISFYTFDETTGSATVADSIRGVSGEGTLFNSPTFTTGRVGNALCLNGTSQYGTAPIVSGVTSEFTISTWVKLDTFTQWATIVKNWGDANVGTFHFGLDGGTQKWSNYLGLVPNSAVSVADPSATTTGQWHHVITTASQSQNAMRLYVNNTKVAERTFSGTITTFGSTMSFGAKLNDQQTQVAPVNPGWLDGCLDELAFWNVALTDAQVSDIYTNGQSGTSPIATTTTSTSTTTTTAPASTTTTAAAVVTTTSSTTSSVVSSTTTTTTATTAPIGDVETSDADSTALPTAGNGTTLAWVALWLVLAGIATVRRTRHVRGHSGRS